MRGCQEGGLKCPELNMICQAVSEKDLTNGRGVPKADCQRSLTNGLHLGLSGWWESEPTQSGMWRTPATGLFCTPNGSHSRRLLTDKSSANPARQPELRVRQASVS